MTVKLPSVRMMLFCPERGSVADPHFELREEAFLGSVMSSFFTQNKASFLLFFFLHNFCFVVFTTAARSSLRRQQYKNGLIEELLNTKL